MIELTQEEKLLEEIRQTKQFVKSVDELQPHEHGYATASKVDRRNKLREMEAAIQKKWKAERTFEQDAGSPGEEKFFCNFPYPYMNGRLHLGHAFTITKADFAAGYQRLKGKKVLFPFAFHCTGMPIQAAANKLAREIDSYGIGNCKAGNFGVEEVHVDLSTLNIDDAQGGGGERAKTQWEILQMCGVPNDEIPQFVSPQHWLEYFPPYGLQDLKYFGVHVDWRRSFITTDKNPYYDSFIQWQFRQLKKEGRIAFGKRPTVYSRRDQQACMDHDRSSGEGKGPQEYTLIKMLLLDDGKATLVKRVVSMAAVGDNTPIYLVAATLRPETMYGQTNCFVLPDGTYGAYRMKKGDIFICSEHSAVNIAHQAEEDVMAVWGQTDKITDIAGTNLLGLPLEAPNATYKRVFTLPLLTISMDKGTGIVTSVPSDAPDDYAALRDMQTKPNLREEYGITEAMVKDYKPVPIIHIPGGDSEIGVEEWGDMAAVTACESLGVRDQHDKAKLVKIKKSVYKKGFDAGVMTIGSQKGKKVEEAKEVVKKELIGAGLAMRYWEPEEEIISRSGDKCVIAFIDQWYLKYGEKSWKAAVLEHIRDKTGLEDVPEGQPKSKDEAIINENTFDAYGVRKVYVDAVDWLGNWACSRSFGLGTKVPWDKQFVVESLSDSTIYMAYYTIAHYLHGEGNMAGAQPGLLGIKAEDLTDDVWNYIFKNGAYPGVCAIPEEKLKKLKNEFEFWYPFDLRVSGKDLTRNHLTMSLFNHAAIWPDQPEMWPRSFFTNGHVMVDNQKMSKSTGNFISLFESIKGNNVHLHVPIEKRRINKVALKAEPVRGLATCTTEQPHGFTVGMAVIISKSKKNDGQRMITSVADTLFTFASAGEENSTSAIVESSEKNWEAHEWRAQSWSTDAVRYALAAAGDSMNDANFESDVANGAILTLDNEIIWVEELTSSDTDLREGDFTVQDKLFLIRMDECIAETDKMYKEMKFAMVIKSGFNDMRIHRKSYRDYHEKCGLRMHQKIVQRFIETLVIMMSPVLTHWSEHIWCNVLKNEGSATRAPWPSPSGFPIELLQQDSFLRDLVSSMRKKLAKKKKGKRGDSDKPKTKAIIYVQTEFPSWKKKALQWLDSKWDDEINGFKGNRINKVALKAETVGGVATSITKQPHGFTVGTTVTISKSKNNNGQRMITSVTDTSFTFASAGEENSTTVIAESSVKTEAQSLKEADEELKAEKMFMAVISFAIDQTASLGRAALATEVAFDEVQLLEESKLYIAASLGLPGGIIVARASDESVEDPDGQKHKAEPGNPSFCMF